MDMIRSIVSHAGVISMLSSGDFWKMYEINKSPGDGHCLLHSIISSLFYQLCMNVTMSELIKGIINEFQMQALGGLWAAWELWEKALIPSLLSGSGTWFGVCDQAVDLCDDL